MFDCQETAVARREGNEILVAIMYRSAGELALFANVAPQNFMDEVAGLLHLRDRQSNVYLLAVAAGADHASSLQHGEVLREIGLGDADLLLDLGDPAFPFADHVEQVQTRGVGEGFTNRGLAFEDFILDGAGPAALHRCHFLGCETKEKNSVVRNITM